MAKNYRLKAEPLGGRNVSAPVETPFRKKIDKKYITAWVKMQSQRQEQQGNKTWPKDLQAKMVDACEGAESKRDMKAAIAKLAKLKAEDL